MGIKKLNYNLGPNISGANLDDFLAHHIRNKEYFNLMLKNIEREKRIFKWIFKKVVFKSYSFTNLIREWNNLKISFEAFTGYKVQDMMNNLSLSSLIIILMKFMIY